MRLIHEKRHSTPSEQIRCKGAGKVIWRVALRFGLHTIICRYYKQSLQ
jgi:hypothetical protein